MDSIKLKQPAKSSFDPNQPFAAANEGQYIQAIKTFLFDEYSSPSLESIRFFAGRLTSGTPAQPALDLFAPIVKEAFRRFVDERAGERLQPVQNGGAEDVIEAVYTPIAGFETDASGNAFVTDEEFEKFFVVDIT